MEAIRAQYVYTTAVEQDLSVDQPMNQTPEITVCLFSYNFEKYLPQALDSVLAQKLEVPFEILVGDDCSTDGSLDILAGYESRFPGLVRVLRSPENLGGTQNWLRTIRAAKGRYVALLDGDDYFTSPDKLQKQYEVLERHAQYSLSFHDVFERFEGVDGVDHDVRYPKELYTLKDIIREGWFIRTSSLFFRKDLLTAELPAWVYDFHYRLDSILPVILCSRGDAHCTREIMSVWRKHSRSMTYELHRDLRMNFITEISLARRLNELTNHRFDRETRQRISRLHTYRFLHFLKKEGTIEGSRDLLFTVLKMDYSYFLLMIKSRYLGTKQA